MSLSDNLDWKALTSRIKTCTDCHLHLTRRNAVSYRGGNTPKIIFIGEAPGKDEDIQGLPFVGRAGKLLDKYIEKIGLSNDDYGIINVLKCRPKDNKFDFEAEKKCVHYLDEQLAILQPRLIVTLGQRATEQFITIEKKFMDYVGQIIPIKKINNNNSALSLFIMFHPALVLYNPGYRKQWDELWQKLQDIIRKEL